ncbi:hypothetical protein AB0N09_28140 [Streptomyces erythrochromogenes]|uniref:hypothetical protein n=1 Tax=Streptomyces erythrochromogenes TaxID=285574 RepID=UPI003428F23B
MPIAPQESTIAHEYEGAPGAEYVFSVSDIARAARSLLGDGWDAASGFWGVTGVVAAPSGMDYLVAVDSTGGSNHGDLYVQDDRPYPLAYLAELTAAHGLDAVAAAVADVIRTAEADET